MLVVNPDRLVVLTWEQIRYYELTRQEDLPLKLFYGKPLYRFEKTDIFFTHLQGPKGIPLLLSYTPSGVVQSRLQIWNTLKSTETIKLLEKYLDQNERIIYLQRYLRNSPIRKISHRLSKISGNLKVITTHSILI